MTRQPVHDRPYQIEVQAGIRDLRPPFRDGSAVLLGYDEQGLACVSQWQTARETDDPPAHFINAMARANRCHCNGYGDEMMTETLLTLERLNDANGTDFGVYGKVHRQNHASLAMLERHGFERFDSDGEYEVWARDLPPYPAITI
ncbi:hypothetical protein GCM10027568_10930 [Humibacter soli]